MTGEGRAYVRIEREIVEARIYERAVDVELEVKPGQYATEALTVLVAERSGSHKPYINGLAISLRVRQTTKAGATPKRGAVSSIDLLSLAKGHVYGNVARLFTQPTIARLRLLAEQVRIEHGTIDWEDVTP